MRHGAPRRPARPVSPSCVPPRNPRTQAAPAAAAGARESCLTPRDTVGVPEDTVGPNNTECTRTAVTHGPIPSRLYLLARLVIGCCWPGRDPYPPPRLR